MEPVSSGSLSLLHWLELYLLLFPHTHEHCLRAYEGQFDLVVTTFLYYYWFLEVETCNHCHNFVTQTLNLDKDCVSSYIFINVSEVDKSNTVKYIILCITTV